jgi:hypothetical protein
MEHITAIDSHVSEEQKSATYRWASSSLQVSSAVAQRALHEYAASTLGTAVIYVCAGEASTPCIGAVAPREMLAHCSVAAEWFLTHSQCVCVCSYYSCLVASTDLSGAKARFAKVTTEHVFSVQPALSASTNTLLAVELGALYRGLLALSESPATQLFVHNRTSGIVCSEVRLVDAPKPHMPAASSSVPLGPTPAPSAPVTNTKVLKPTTASAFFGIGKAPAQKAAGEGKAAGEDKAAASAPSKLPPGKAPLATAAITSAMTMVSSNKFSAASMGEEAEWDGKDSDGEEPK